MSRDQQEPDDRPLGSTSPDPRTDPRTRRCAAHGTTLYPGELCAPCQDPVEIFHAHLDGCIQCETQPFNLCPAGASLLRSATVDRTPDLT